VTSKGTVLAWCEARKEAGDWDAIDILVRRSTDVGKTWTFDFSPSVGRSNDRCLKIFADWLSISPLPQRLFHDESDRRMAVYIIISASKASTPPRNE
jgi:hypothetical protein